MTKIIRINLPAHSGHPDNNCYDIHFDNGATLSMELASHVEENRIGISGALHTDEDYLAMHRTNLQDEANHLQALATIQAQFPEGTLEIIPSDMQEYHIGITPEQHRSLLTKYYKP